MTTFSGGSGLGSPHQMRKSEMSGRSPLLMPGSLEHALQWTGFRALTQAEATAGPFVQPHCEQRYVRFEPQRYAIAFVVALERGGAPVQLLERLEQHVWGYDLNLEQRAGASDVINEFWFVATADPQPVCRELVWLGFQHRGQFWTRSDAECRVPALDANHTDEIFPCLGWVPVQDATSEFATADQRTGFCSRTVPAGAQSVCDGRGYRFVYSGYPERVIARRRIVTFIDPSRGGADAQALVAQALVAQALALTYGEAFA